MAVCRSSPHWTIWTKKPDRILTEPKNALVKQYQKLFDFDDIELELTDDALNAIAAEAIARKTGARGLRSIMEGTLMDTMYTTPSVENVKKIVVDADCVKGTAKPRFYDASGKEITNVPQESEKVRFLPAQSNKIE